MALSKLQLETLVVSLEAQIAAAKASLAGVDAQRQAVISQEIITLQSELTATQTALLQADFPGVLPTPPTTAGKTVNDDSIPNPAKRPPLEADPNTGRITTFPDTTTATNADQTKSLATGDDTYGTNQPTKTFATTQATTGGTEPGPRKIPGDGQGGGNGGNGEVTGQPRPGTSFDSSAPNGSEYITATGAGPNDDGVTVSPAVTTTIINNGYNNDQVITPQPNILDNFASYAYSASVYLMTPVQYITFVNTKKRTVNGYNLLFQSGGAPTNVGGPRNVDAATGTNYGAFGEAPTGTAQPDAGRSPFFPVDFYIDSLTLTNALPGKQTQAAHMVSEIKFTVVEPNGISLIDRLYQAVQDTVPKDGAGNINYTAVQYLLAIRWYGYDENGNLKPGKTPPGQDGLSDPNAIVEKFVPFLIKKINWGVSNKLVTYDFECAPVNQLIAASASRGTIPYDVELSDSTVSKLLGGDSTYASATAPPKANAAPTTKTTIKQGLMGAMNDFQKQLVQEGKYEQADVYEIEFAAGAEPIRDAAIILPGKKANTSATPMAPPITTDPSGVDPKKGNVDNTVRNFAITAGQQLVQAIDLTIRNSNFITKQASVIREEEPIDDEDQEPSTNTAGTKTLQWFQISMQSTPLKYDKKRNDYAYNIKYIISPYTVPNFDSKYFPVAKFNGLHKSYQYWFTGENTSVLDYQANFNFLYNITVSGSEPTNSAAAQLRQKYTSSMRDIPKYNYQAASTESRAGAKLAGHEVAANAAEYLYSPSEMGQTKIRIVGDPAWIQQGSQSAGVQANNFDYNGFLPDGTINFDSQQVMFEIAWQRPEDYDLNTGLADPYSQSSGTRQPAQSVVYQARKCVSEFRQGRFEQTIEGSLYMFPIPATAQNTTALKTSASAVNSSGIAERTSSTATQTTADTPPIIPGNGATAAPVNVNTVNTATDANASANNNPSILSNQLNSGPTSNGADIGVNVAAPNVLNTTGAPTTNPTQQVVITP